MGMFDSLVVECPNCRDEIEFQSKSGECMLTIYNKYNISPYVAIGMDYDIIKCGKCKKNIQVEFNIPKKVGVKLTITKREATY